MSQPDGISHLVAEGIIDAVHARLMSGKEATVYVGFLDRPLTAADTRAVMTFKTDVDDFHVKGREVYWLRKTRLTDSPFKYVSLEKKLKIRCTFRGLNTVARLAAKHGPS